MGMGMNQHLIVYNIYIYVLIIEHLKWIKILVVSDLQNDQPFGQSYDSTDMARHIFSSFNLTVGKYNIYIYTSKDVEKKPIESTL